MVWVPALAAAGLAGVHIHDLRHTCTQFTANAGANTKELMVRMGHDSERATLIYLHSPDERQRALADAVGKAARAELAESKKRKSTQPSGTRVARGQADRSKTRAGERIRTADRPLTRRVLCQLSYTGRLVRVTSDVEPLQGYRFRGVSANRLPPPWR